MLIRDERTADAPAIRDLVETAFRDKSFSDGTEHLIVDALRRQHALTLSLVAEEEGSIVGQAAFRRSAPCSTGHPAARADTSAVAA
jgi:putative acetyltransferase